MREDDDVIDAMLIVTFVLGMALGSVVTTAIFQYALRRALRKLR
jgi:hypothetical protein